MIRKTRDARSFFSHTLYFLVLFCFVFFSFFVGFLGIFACVIFIHAFIEPFPIFISTFIYISWLQEPYSYTRYTFESNTQQDSFSRLQFPYLFHLFLIFSLQSNASENILFEFLYFDQFKQIQTETGIQQHFALGIFFSFKTWLFINAFWWIWLWDFTSLLSKNEKRKKKRKNICAKHTNKTCTQNTHHSSPYSSHAQIVWL